MNLSSTVTIWIKENKSFRVYQFSYLFFLNARSITIYNVTFSNGSQKIVVEEEVGPQTFDSLKLNMRKTTESEQKRNLYFTVKMILLILIRIFMTCSLLPNGNIPFNIRHWFPPVVSLRFIRGISNYLNTQNQTR